jgi:hypothetical protein
MVSIGLPLSAEKHVPMSERFTFLGVDCHFSECSDEGTVTLSISRERDESRANEAEAYLAADALSAGAAAKFAGRLTFATSWAAGQLGRAVLRPIYDQALMGGSQAPSPLLPSVRRALRFFVEILRRPGGLPPRTFRFARRERPTVRIWTDAMYERGKPAGLAFYVEFPAEPDRGQPLTERVHGSFLAGADEGSSLQYVSIRHHIGGSGLRDRPLRAGQGPIYRPARAARRGGTVRVARRAATGPPGGALDR